MPEYRESFWESYPPIDAEAVSGLSDKISLDEQFWYNSGKLFNHRINEEWLLKKYPQAKTTEEAKTFWIKEALSYREKYLREIYDRLKY